METQINPKSVIQALQAQATKSPAFNAMCHVFAMRERTRQQVTIANLVMTMTKEGFKFTKQDYLEELKFLASIGIGNLAWNARNKITMLKNIKVTLQSIGMSGLAKASKLETIQIPPRFIKLPAEASTTLNFPVVKETAPPLKLKANYKATLNVQHDGKQLVFELEKEIPVKDLLAFVSELYAKKIK